MPTNKELEQRVKELEERLNQPAETPPIKHVLSDEDMAILDALKVDNETYGTLITALSDKLDGMVDGYSTAFNEIYDALEKTKKLVVVLCAHLSEFVEEPGVKALNFNFSRRLREILATQMPTLSKSMEDE